MSARWGQSTHLDRVLVVLANNGPGSVAIVVNAVAQGLHARYQR